MRHALRLAPLAILLAACARPEMSPAEAKLNELCAEGSTEACSTLLTVEEERKRQAEE